MIEYAKPQKELDIVTFSTKQRWVIYQVEGPEHRKEDKRLNMWLDMQKGVLYTQLGI